MQTSAIFKTVLRSTSYKTIYSWQKSMQLDQRWYLESVRTVQIETGWICECRWSWDLVLLSSGINLNSLSLRPILFQLGVGSFESRNPSGGNAGSSDGPAHVLRANPTCRANRLSVFISGLKSRRHTVLRSHRPQKRREQGRRKRWWRRPSLLFVELLLTKLSERSVQLDVEQCWAVWKREEAVSMNG